ncbi:hypothetical protein RR48_13829 [Papilio machaon]|uniref:Uncharacterized protein n=1 Tax=Papilio machaon TaxID=76193 RepID=A0A194RGM9_PAPMA|nr:hypothetical protein RR48_13829 [Papilio machaon]
MSSVRKSVMLLVLALYFSVVVRGENVSTTAPAPHPLSSIDVRPSGAIASFLKMLVDIPLALVEAFRDISVVIIRIIKVYDKLRVRL